MRYPGFIGPSYTLQSLAAGVERCVNLYTEPNEVGAGKSPMSLIGTPGLSLFTTLSSGPVRQLVTCYGVASGNPRVFAVHGPASGSVRLAEINSNGTNTDRGQLTASGWAGAASMPYNETQLMITGRSADKPWRLRFSDNNLAQITAAPQALVHMLYLDGFFIGASALASERDRFYISALKDGDTWDALDFDEAESSPDILTAMITSQRRLWLFGQHNIEIWFNSGNADFPFEPVQGAIIHLGCGAGYSANRIGNTMFWLSHDDTGRGVIYRANGYHPERISTYAVETALRESGDLPAAISWTYQDQGHDFYVLYLPDVSRTWVYDLTASEQTGKHLWHERMYLNGSTEEAHRGSCHTFAFWETTPFKGKHLVGDRVNGNVYEMSNAFYSDDGNKLRVIRRAPHLHNEGKRIFYPGLELDAEVGTVYTTTLNGSHTAAVTTITVASTTNFLSAGTIMVDSEKITYTGKTATTFTGATRGAHGTAAASHLTAATVSAVSEYNLTYSDDGGNTFSSALQATTGATVDYKARLQWSRLGSARSRVFNISSDAPIRHCWTDAFLLPPPTVGSH